MKTTRSLLLCVGQFLLLAIASSFTLRSAATPSDTNEVWISARTNALGTGVIFGNGAITNPFYGDFDAIMRSLATNTTIHLLPGVHYTMGYYHSFELTNYQRVIGAGIDTTTVRRDTNYFYDSYAMEGVLHSYSDGVEVRDLTLDANANGSETHIQQAISLGGNYCKIQRVRAINTFGSTSTAGQCFSVSVAGTRSLISEVEVSSVLGTYCAAISLLSGVGGIVEHCRVSFPALSSGGPVLQAYYAKGTYDALFDGNVCEGGYGGFRTATLSETNLTIINSTFRNVFYGIALSKSTGGNIDGAALRNNTIEISTNIPTGYTGYGIIAKNSDQTGSLYYRNIVIAGNTIHSYNNGTASPGTYAILANSPVVTNYLGLRILDNTIDKSLLIVLGAQSTWLADNMDITGVPLHFRQVGTGSLGTVTLDPIDGSVLVSSSTTTNITLPTAFGFSAKEILICNLKASGNLTISPVSGQGMWPSGSITLPAGETTKFISDGSSVWVEQYGP
jgi:hypothetical protein